MTAATGLAPIGAHSRSDSAGQGSLVRNKWQLLKVIEDIREPLGLKGTSLALLRAMLSFVRSDAVTAARDDAHICFASNAALATRAHVSVQTVERHVAKLVALGLLVRKSSSNGKRWARRDEHGRIVLATGLSLLPLVSRHAEFLGMAKAQETLRRDLALLRDKCATALTELRTVCPTAYESLATRARRLFRRKPDGDALQELLVDITEEIVRLRPSCPEKLRGIDPENEGHKETSLNPSVEKKASFSIDVDPDQMERAYPRLCTELRFARSQEACSRQLDELASQLHLGPLWLEIRDLGPALSFMILGYILERVESIRIPRAYARTLLVGLQKNWLDWRTLLTRPNRQPAPLIASNDRGRQRPRHQSAFDHSDLSNPTKRILRRATNLTQGGL